MSYYESQRDGRIIEALNSISESIGKISERICADAQYCKTEYKIPKQAYEVPSRPEMNYESPITLVSNSLQTQLEGDVLEAILSYGVIVDKEELIKALKYDRDQYVEGFTDGCLMSVEDRKSVKRATADDIFGEIDKLLTIIRTDESGTAFVGVNMQKYYELRKTYTEVSGEEEQK